MNALRVVSLLLIGLVSAAASANDASLAGAWKLTTDVAGVHRERSCSFEQKGTSFSGPCKNEDGQVAVTGTVTGDKVTLQYEAEVFGQKINSVCTGNLIGTKVAGSLSLPAFGLEGECTVTRS